MREEGDINEEGRGGVEAEPALVKRTYKRAFPGPKYGGIYNVLFLRVPTAPRDHIDDVVGEEANFWKEAGWKSGNGNEVINIYVL